jgi:hypothetical protein
MGNDPLLFCIHDFHLFHRKKTHRIIRHCKIKAVPQSLKEGYNISQLIIANCVLDVFAGDLKIYPH